MTAKTEKKNKEVKVQVTFTEGYEQRFTQAMIKLCEAKIRKENEKVG